MWFLARAVFWLSVMALLLPAAPTRRAAPPARSGADAVSTPARSDLRASRWPEPDGRHGPVRTRASQSTLTPADRVAAWRGPHP
jgi:hypothetical protein